MASKVILSSRILPKYLYWLTVSTAMPLIKVGAMTRGFRRKSFLLSFVLDIELQVKVITPFDSPPPWSCRMLTITESSANLIMSLDSHWCRAQITKVTKRPSGDPVEHITASEKVSLTRVLSVLIVRKSFSQHIVPKSMPHISESLRARRCCMQLKADEKSVEINKCTCVFLSSRCPSNKIQQCCCGILYSLLCLICELEWVSYALCHGH